MAKQFLSTSLSTALILSALVLTACDVKFGDRDAADTPKAEKAAADKPTPRTRVRNDGARADALHARILTLDTHVDIPLNYMTHERDPGGLTEAQVDLPKMRLGGLDAAFFVVYTPQAQTDAAGYAQAAQIAETRYAAIDRLVRAYPSEITLAKTAEQVRRTVKNGRKAALMGMENAYPLGPDLSQLELWRGRGIRYVGLTHFGHNQFGDSSNPSPLRDNGPRHNGLSELGRQLVTLLNDMGIMIDVSHAGKATMMQAAKLSRAPIIASHSGVKAIGDSPRNLDDEQLRAIADSGGVAQMVALGAYVKPLTPSQIAARDKVRRGLGILTDLDLSTMTPDVKSAYEQRMRAVILMEPPATVADFVDHIDYAVSVAGIDHVGIASDFDGGGGILGWQDASETPSVTRELLSRGYSERDIAKIWGGNLLRVMEAAERAAK